MNHEQRPPRGGGQSDQEERVRLSRAGAGRLLIPAGVLFAAEVFIMFSLGQRAASLWWAILLDAGLLVAISVPLMDYFLYRPLERERLERQRALEASNRELEGRVAERTAHLAREVAEREEAQRRLQEQEELLSRVLDAIDEAVVAYGPDLRVSFFNRKFIEYSGYDPEWLARRPSLEEVIRRACELGTYPLDAADEIVRQRRTAPEARAAGRRFSTPRLDGRVVDGYSTRLPEGGLLLTFRDVTAERRAEAAVRRSEARYRSMLDAMDDLVYICAADYSVEYMNRAMIERVGRDAVGEPCYEALHDREGICPWCTAEAVLKGETRRWEHVHPDTGRAYYVSNLPLHREDGSVSRLAVIRDITERKEAEEAINRSVSLLACTLESTGDGILALDRNGKILVHNRKFLEVWGLSDEGFRAGDEPDAIAQCAARTKDPEMFLQRLCEIRSRPGEESYDAVELADGRILVQLSVPQRIEGAPVGRVWSFRDVTERERNRRELARLATAMEHSAEAIVVMDTDGKIVYLNPAHERITGYARDEMLGRREPIEDPKLGREIRRVLEHGESWSGHLLRRRKDGATYEEECTLSPVRDGSGGVVNYVAVRKDATREVRLEQQLRHSQKLEALGTLAGGIAHDFNNLLTGIMGYAELTSESLPAEAPGRSYLVRVLAACERAKELVRQILAYSRPADKSRETVRLDDVVSESLKLLRAVIPKNIELRYQPGESSGLVWADATQLGQVLMNLCTNAAHAMNGSVGTIQVSLSEREVGTEAPDLEPGLYAVLAVEDTGCGIPDVVLERIFEPFFTTKDVGAGTGLGLSVAHGIAKSHGGTVRVKSEVGKGSRFEVFLPRLQTREVRAAESEEPVAKGSESVLYVDDEESLAELGRGLLESLGYTVRTATGGEEALEAMRASPGGFDLLVTDQSMPKMTGDALAREVRRISPDLPVILCTGLAPAVTPEHAEAAGIVEVVRKPATRGELAAAVRRALDRRPAAGEQRVH
ncbi:MAG: PAS domain S-box protein [Deltaproteobacteria bacterium]|nr:PAS domain S-box protein [Deltaproteobacteria bacterium]